MATSQKIKILYVDDEVNNLYSFKAMFRHDYEVLTAQSADAGMQVLAENPDITIIFSDQRMPGKTGVEFFKEVASLYPDPVRMLITGYIDIETVIDAINHGHVFRYLTKPWQEVEVRSAIEEGYKLYMTSSLLNAKIQELQETNAELDKFSYSVTHDIRGPVVSILGGLQILQTLDDIDEMKQLAEMMTQSAEKVRDLITNIHSYYNLKRGDLNIQDIQFDTFLSEVLELHQVQARLHGVTVEPEIVQKEPFRSDPTVLQLVFNNLLSNAIKYQRNDEVDKVISIRILVEKGVAMIVIRDNGIGIDPAHIDDIFKMFYRATKEGLGSGFGLYNVKDALNKLNGTIDVTSELGVYTEFTIQIPSK